MMYKKILFVSLFFSKIFSAKPSEFLDNLMNEHKWEALGKLGTQIIENLSKKQDLTDLAKKMALFEISNLIYSSILSLDINDEHPEIRDNKIKYIKYEMKKMGFLRKLSLIFLGATICDLLSRDKAHFLPKIVLITGLACLHKKIVSPKITFEVKKQN